MFDYLLNLESSCPILDNYNEIDVTIVTRFCAF